ncbi:NADH-ubiquinone oxidoreductase-F iron-sulfur binding region domain-containing protein [Patulibacter sp.]|uniref:NADH-ubiquinone oxidoreductase-F iron-sulfur binding region domain-containing protein n=1 Tax=Patulibacter sp. TaxID=1912859 RepID=UPI0027278F20|nr:NADH-ubiquinone oxidoreductase-F iron-sulfur binding region domain-containing protein [Patulibacter sp.]MDO9408968.1 NADH-ubiquinone oxidoreductase-F iron-sulfur binding region domain-containing protein [Patulibacter sp.]
MSTRLLSAAVPHVATDLTHHRAVHGRLPDLGRGDADALIRTVADAGLRGRGGAGFPTARKLEAVAGARRPVVVVNGTEGEPASGKDRLLLATQPHLVLDGAVTAARAVGAREVVLVAPRTAHAALGRALDERGARDEPEVRLVVAAEGYVAGEETAVLAHVEGRPARPRVAPPRPAERGLFRRPTLVQNVETLAHLALIARHGADGFRSAGTPERPGTTLVSVSGAVARRGVFEVPVGVPVDQVLGLAGGPAEPVRALLVGGYFGAWIDGAARPALTDRDLRPLGAAVGAGVVLALGASSCPVAAVARLGSWMAGQSAGQCGSCVNGLAAIAGVLERLADGRGTPADLGLLTRWTAMVDGRGACAHPTGTVRMITSATRLFAAELEDHAHHGRCATCATAARASSVGVGRGAVAA